jgi:preprotein translocase subunit SecF
MHFHFDFVGRWKIWFACSGFLLAVALFSVLHPGLNYGIDFTGGTQTVLQFARPVAQTPIQDVLNRYHLTDSTIVYLGHSNREVQITTATVSQTVRDALLTTLKTHVGRFTEISSSRVSGVIGQETEETALLAVLLATAGIILYIALRFEFRFAISAIIALVHDVAITVGMIALIHISLSQYFVMAVLTIFGYSVNDTIIIFDRIRENLQRQKRGEPLEDVVNRSLNQVVVRSINTSSTVLIALAALLVFGGASLEDFSLTMLIGVFLGTYSSLFIASPIWLLWRNKSPRPGGRQAA